MPNLTTVCVPTTPPTLGDPNRTQYRAGLCSLEKADFWDTEGYTSTAPGAPPVFGPVFFSSKPPARPPDAAGNPRPYGSGYFALTQGGDADVKGYFVLDRD